MEIQFIKSLLNQITDIRNHYEEIAQTTGENFNIFRVLNVESNEIRLHSALLGELLNPKGSHGQKDVFLKSFVKQFNIEGFETIGATLEIEKHIGGTTETTGGRIDILVESGDKKHKIIIENKIYAGDQQNQLVRYHNFDRTAHLFYLTLKGGEPSEGSKGSLESGTNYTSISYIQDIISWLENCRKEAVTHTLLRETITQYINLINYLTGKSMSQVTNDEIVKFLIKDDENLKSAYLISASTETVENEIIKEYFIPQIKKLEEDLKNKFGIMMELNEQTFFQKWTGFYFMKTTEWKYFKIGYIFDRNNKQGFSYGICWIDVNNKNKELEKALKEKLPYINKSTNYWPRWKQFEKYENWNNAEAMIALKNGEITEQIKCQIEEIIKNIQGIEL
jgi:hypothetical protein